MAELQRRQLIRSGAALARYLSAGAVVAAWALLCWFAFGPSQLADAAMVLLLGVTVVSMRLGRGPSLFAAALSALAFDFFFIPPAFSLEIDDLSHTITFGVMMFVAFVVSQLTTRVRSQALEARDRERRTASLYAIGRELGLAPSSQSLLSVAAEQVKASFGVPVLLLTPNAEEQLEARAGDREAKAIWEKERNVSYGAWKQRAPKGVGSDSPGNSRGLYLPLQGSRGCAGVLCLIPGDPSRFRDPGERDLIAALGRLIGSALERTQLADEASQARRRVEAEQLRNALLSSLSHDFRTPLGVVVGATSTLLEPDGPRDEGTRRRLLETAHSEALRLNRHLVNVLQMTRLEAGALPLRSEPQSIEEVVGAALGRLEDRLLGRDVTIDLPEELPLVPFDLVLIQQVLLNLLENATKYSDAGAPVRIAATRGLDSIEIEVADRGPGVAREDAARIFEKYHRVNDREGGGFGLGLAICHGIVVAHGGRIWVEDRPGGGASFRFTLPLEPGGPLDLGTKGSDPSGVE